MSTKKKSILVDKEIYDNFKAIAKKNSYMVKPLIEHLMWLYIQGDADYDDDESFIPKSSYRRGDLDELEMD